MIKKYVLDVTKPYYYIVGPQSFVSGIIELVKEMGIADEKIIKENFVGY